MDSKKKARKQSAESPVAVRKRRRKKRDERRRELRDAHWPEADRVIWNRLQNDGWTSVPRLMPLILTFQRKLSSLRDVKGDPSSVYLDLWTRTYDDGFVVIPHENECAFASGYSGTRAIRTWQERMYALETLNFIRTAAVGNRQYAHVLIINPLHVCAYWRYAKSSSVPDELWNAFRARADEVGSEIPDQNSAEIVVNGIPF